MNVYLDTCIISGLAKEDISKKEICALLTLLQLGKESILELFTSSVTKDELDKIPQEHRSKHLIIYNLFSDVPKIDYLVLNLSPVRIGLRVKKQDVLAKLINILKDKEDAMHLYQCFRNKLEYFITVDQNSILSKAKEIKLVCKIDVYTPSDFLALYNNNCA